jgi:outer membrane protein assembly factor BamB
MTRRPLTLVLAIAMVLTIAVAPVAAADRFPARIDLPPSWSPEGITAGAGTTIYVGSLAGGGVWAGDVRTGSGAILVPPWGGAATGVDYEEDANRLWVAGGPTGTVRVYDASSGDLLRQYSFSPAGFLNDLVVTSEAVYVTDSFNAWLDVIPLGPNGALHETNEVTTLPLAGITSNSASSTPTASSPRAAG